MNARHSATPWRLDASALLVHALATPEHVGSGARLARRRHSAISRCYERQAHAAVRPDGLGVAGIRSLLHGDPGGPDGSYEPKDARSVSR